MSQQELEMKRVPRSREVEQAILAVAREVKAAAKDLSTEAGRMLARGKFDMASAMVERCRLLGEFGAKVGALRREWKALRIAGKAGDKKLVTTPVWKLYQPIAVALSRLHGQAKRIDLEQELGVTLDGKLMPGDLEPTGKGVPRWRISGLLAISCG
jgi:hypothetical protein